MVGIGSLGSGSLHAGSRPNLGLSILATAVVAVAFQPVRERVQRLANRLVFGKRATPYEALSEFAGRMGGTYAADAGNAWRAEASFNAMEQYFFDRPSGDYREQRGQPAARTPGRSRRRSLHISPSPRSRA